jgi:hypothetical protein
VLRLFTALALIGLLAWIGLTRRGALSDLADRMARAEDEPIADTVEALGGPRDAYAKAHTGDLTAGCQVAVARALGLRCGRPVRRSLAPAYPALVAACAREWPASTVACLVEQDCPTPPISCGP